MAWNRVKGARQLTSTCALAEIANSKCRLMMGALLSREPAPRSRWHARRAQQCDRHPAERMAPGGDAVLGRARLRERTRVDGACQGEQASGVALVDRIYLLRAQFDTVERLSDDVVDQESLDRCHDGLHVGRRHR